MDKAFDRTKLRQIDSSTKGMASAQYNLCLYRCDEKETGYNGVCKQSCYDKIMVPFHMIKH